MESILDFPGLVGAFILTVLIILPIIIRSLRQQNQSKERERRPLGSSDPLPPITAVECRACGQINRVPMEAERALCGRCKGELIGPKSSVGKSC